MLSFLQISHVYVCKTLLNDMDMLQKMKICEVTDYNLNKVKYLTQISLTGLVLWKHPISAHKTILEFKFLFICSLQVSQNCDIVSYCAKRWKKSPDKLGIFTQTSLFIPLDFVHHTQNKVYLKLRGKML